MNDIKIQYFQISLDGHEDSNEVLEFVKNTDSLTRFSYTINDHHAKLRINVIKWK